MATATGVAVALLIPTLLSTTAGASQASISVPTPTRLVASDAFGRQSPSSVVIKRLEARLTTEAGRPVGGRTIRFTVQGHRACSATTNSHGVAACRAVLEGVHLASGTYLASFKGDRQHGPSTGIGALYVTNGPPPPPTTTTVPNPTTTFPPPTSTSVPGSSTSVPGSSTSFPLPSTTSTSNPGGTLPPPTVTTIPPDSTTTIPGGSTTVPQTTIPPPTTTILPPTTTIR